ncbi:hypothetical protein [Taylorella equigenitalis]|uniref:Uncharacterized protein n=3 Tax=Taylorella equigenitalis TaxID=29575 RepID=A0A654KHH6_TAYEM|nr:hypothetical protein [Taylorella equigenitalis]ADU91849.1 hypothetical protein TEQUI_0917 [Taylorella equigenitalis MCE9]AFN35414.1 hypothetical protein KUI_0319 [Taylorella equigenitalis ATCC 35865]WDU46666.1 hypothetical protein KNO33_01410 [Taylorella equigenitalis]WDU48150.1 hypothetical protein KNO30_01450 [Taylorella equigenitalis]WDU49659.1 hypothetical protein KNO34_01425 [Taylorella equigenitalis]
MKLLNRFRNEFRSQDSTKSAPETSIDQDIQKVVNELAQSILPSKDETIKPLLEVSLK